MDFLKSNQKLKIIPEDIRGISSGIIKEVYQDSFTVILDNSNDCRLTVNSNVEIIIPTENCLLGFKTGIIKIENNYADFSIPLKFKEIQRREYTRINVSIPVNLSLLNNPDSNFNSVTRNLSGGGMQIISEKDLSIGDLLKARFTILNTQEIETVLETLRIDRDEQDAHQYFLSGRFKEISNRDRAAIVQLCFKRKLELNCKDIMSDESLI